MVTGKLWAPLQSLPEAELTDGQPDVARDVVLFKLYSGMGVVP